MCWRLHKTPKGYVVAYTCASHNSNSFRCCCCCCWVFVFVICFLHFFFICCPSAASRNKWHNLIFKFQDQDKQILIWKENEIEFQFQLPASSWLNDCQIDKLTNWKTGLPQKYANSDTTAKRIWYYYQDKEESHPPPCPNDSEFLFSKS